MKPFNLEEYLANPSRKVVTRDGQNARIICTDRKDSDAPIVALVGFRSAEGEICLYYTKEGKIYTDDSLASNADLFFATEKHEGWVNVYRGLKSDKLYCANVFESKELAKGAGDGSIATVKIEWEE